VQKTQFLFTSLKENHHRHHGSLDSQKTKEKKQKSQEFISRFEVTHLSFSAYKHTNAKSKF
jgi:hypothetical protein